MNLKEYFERLESVENLIYSLVREDGYSMENAVEAVFEAASHEDFYH